MQHYDPKRENLMRRRYNPNTNFMPMSVFDRKRKGIFRPALITLGQLAAVFVMVVCLFGIVLLFAR